jgi:hypothetical protein
LSDHATFAEDHPIQHINFFSNGLNAISEARCLGRKAATGFQGEEQFLSFGERGREIPEPFGSLQGAWCQMALHILRA